MNHAPINPEHLSLVELALWLEQQEPHSAGPRDGAETLRPGDADRSDSVQSLEEARLGLELVRRAVLSDRLREACLCTSDDDTAMRDPLVETTAGGESSGTGKSPPDPAAVLHRSTGSEDSTGSKHRLGRFEILRELGRGGFGVVLLGRDPHLERLVAIKVPRADSLFDSDARKRFDREARLGSLLSHPAIVPILESRTDGAVNYIAFAWCGGESLAAWFQKHDRRISVRLAARIVMQLAHAVQYAHQRGVIHRDLKPSNILLDPSGDQEQTDDAVVAALRITDFGLARSTSVSDADLTREGAIVGTPAYMAPEQAGGSPEAATASADIYSLGVILYELLTGQQPLRKSTDLATLRAVETEIPPSPRKLRPDLPVDLEAVCLRCLEKSPHRRYPSAHDLLEDLNSFLEYRPVQARRVGRLERAVRWCRRNPPLASALTVVVMGFVIAMWQWRRAEVSRIQAEHHLAESVAQSERAARSLVRSEQAIDQMLNDVADTLIHIPRLEGLRQRLLTQALELQRGQAADQADAPGVRLRVAQAFRRRGEILVRLGELAQSREALESAAAELSHVALSETGDEEILLERGRIAAALCPVFLKLEAYSDMLDAAATGLQALDPVVSSARADDVRRLRADIYHSRGIASEAKQDYSGAVAAYQEILALSEQVPAENRGPELEVQRGRALNSLGVVFTKMNHADQAEPYFRESIETLDRVARRQPERIDLGYFVATTSINLGNRYSRRAEHPAAVPYYELARRILSDLRTAFPENSAYRRMDVIAASGLGLSQWRAGDPAGGSAILRQALDDHRRLPEQLRVGLESRDTEARLLMNLANLLLDSQTESGEAQEYYQQAIALREQLCRELPERIDFRQALSMGVGNLAASHLKSGETEAAKNSYHRALGIAESVLAAQSSFPSALSNAAWQLNGLCDACVRLEAIDELQAAVREFVNRGSQTPARYLAAVEALAAGIARIDERNAAQPVGTASDPVPNPAPAALVAVEPTDQADVRETLMSLVVEILTDAVAEGHIAASRFSGEGPWSPLMSDERIQKLVNDAQQPLSR